MQQNFKTKHYTIHSVPPQQRSHQCQK